ncbi:MAG: hypothetical protein ABIG87_00540 [Patescibacteria group bacterium]
MSGYSEIIEEKMGSATIFINNNKLWKNNCFVSRKKYNLIMAKGRNQRKNIKKPKKDKKSKK